MPSKKEQRRFVRLPFRRDATLEGPEGAIEAKLEDISLNGVRLSLEGDRPGPDTARYRLSVALAPGATVRMEVSVVHLEGERVGFQCRRMDSKSLVNLKRMLALYYGSGGSEQMNAELETLQSMIRRNPADQTQQAATAADDDDGTR